MRIGTRRSPLALAQARQVAERIGGCEIVEISTRGDAGATDGDKSRWVAELEQALLDGSIDIAVHSAKDVPGELAPGLALLHAPPRAAREDVLCWAPDLDSLASGSRVGTSSVRRLAQLRAAREDIEVVPVRGNVDTRLRKLAEGTGLDAIVLARAGLQRLGRDAEAGGVLDAGRFVPAPGQGALALEGRAGDEHALAAATAAGDEATLACLLAERALARALEAGCHTPLGASAELVDGSAGMRLRAWVGLPDGSAWICDELTAAAGEPQLLGRSVAARMRAAGAAELLRAAEGEQQAVGG